MAKQVSKVPKSVKMRPEQHKSVEIYPKFAKVSQNEKNARSAQKYHSMLQVQNQRKWPMLKVLKGSFLGTPIVGVGVGGRSVVAHCCAIFLVREGVKKPSFF